MTPTDPYRRVWEAFAQMDSTIDGRHDTPYWRAHAGPYAACVIRVPPSQLQPDLDILRRDLARLYGVRLHPDHFLHIMLQELGFVVDLPQLPDELTAARLEEFAQATASAVSDLSPAIVSIGGANSFQDAIFLDIGGGELLQVMHERLFDLAAVPRLPDYPYLPHCTIAHYEGATSPRAAIPVLAPWRDAICGEFDVSEIEIVTIDPSDAYPELESYAVIPLGS